MTRTTRSRRAARPLALAVGVLALLGTVGTTSAGAVQTTTAATETAPVMIVLDASGSMNEDDAPGPRIDAAKTAVRDLVSTLPAEAEVGLTVYGTKTGSSDAEKTVGCQDITQLAPVGKVDRTALTSAVDGIRASGYTPIGASLQKAAAALPKEGPRSVVLVSDGEDTCSPPPPCDVAQQLKQQGVDLIVHTVGFKVDDAARAQLTCIAQATGGTYSDATDAGSLGTSIDQQVSRGLEPYDVQGQPVTGTSGPGSAPELEPGQYSDTSANAGDDYGRSGPGKYYAVDLREGETPYLSATVVPEAQDTGSNLDQVLLTATLTAGSASTSGCKISEYGQSTSVQGKILTTSVVVAPGAVGGPDWPDGCPTSGTFYFFVSRNFGGDGDLPMEIAYRSEPQVEDTAGLPAPAAATAVPALPTPGTTSDLAGGASFNSAPEVEPGRTYADSVVFGEDRYFKVHLDWGQQFAVRVDTEQVSGVRQLQGAYTYVRGANPVRQELSDLASQTDAGFAFLGGQAGQLSGGSTVPVRWTNRQSTDSTVSDYAIDGDYYVVLSAGYSNGAPNPSAAVPYQITVDVTGTKESGPKYLQDQGSTSSASPSGAASNGPTNGAATGAQGTTPMPAAEPSSWTTQRTTVVGGAIGVAVLAAIVLGWLLLGRRRSPRPPQPPVMPPTGGGWS